MISGSAGEGVQSAAEFFSKAAMVAGLNTTKKGSYPVTVGVGFSASEIIVSSEQILYTGSPIPDVLIVTSIDGLNYARSAAGKMKTGLLLIDESLEVPETGAQVIKVPFRERVGARNSAIYTMFWYLNHSNIFTLDALKDVFKGNKISEKVQIDTMLKF
jgi:Pyruvate/2-oxoacid:ferredoxin oxidoreductase gamma subunit